MPSVSRRREPVGHRHRHGDEAVLVDEEMRDADAASALGVGLRFSAQNASLLEAGEHLRDVPLGRSAAGGKQVVAVADAALLADVPPLVGELAEESVEPDGADAARAGVEAVGINPAFSFTFFSIWA